MIQNDTKQILYTLKHTSPERRKILTKNSHLHFMHIMKVLVSDFQKVEKLKKSIGPIFFKSTLKIGTFFQFLP